MVKSKSNHPEAIMRAFQSMIDAVPGVELKGAANPYTSLNGHMFSFVTKESVLALRLPEQARLEFMKRYKTELCVQHGTVMKEYVVVPSRLLKKPADLASHFRTSYEYVASLKPKPTTRKKKAGATSVTKKSAAKKATAKSSSASKKKARNASAKKAALKKSKAK